MNDSASPIDLEKTYLGLDDGPAARAIEVPPDFWQTIDTRDDLGERLVAVFRFEGNWKNWEMHPAGDEVVVILEGAVEMIFEEAGGERRIPLRAGDTCIVPRGVWHSVDVVFPARALHITRGEGTAHRPR